MRVCLVRCPSPFLIDERCFPPLGLMSVGTTLYKQGHDVVIHDGPLSELPLDFRYYGFGPTTPEYPYALESLRTIKHHNPTARVIIGGAHVTINPGDALTDGFDCVVTGDGEWVATEAFLTDATRLQGLEVPLDCYPIPDRSLLDIKKYKFLLNGRPATTLVTGRGCPYRCAFCCKNHTTVRLASAARVIEEIEYLYNIIGYTALAFPEDIFILDRERTESICSVLRSLSITWRCLVRADLVVRYGPEFLRTMSSSGCVEVGMGVESGSDTILANINKGETVATIKQAVRMLKGAGIRVKGYFIVGLPGESHDTLAETREFLDEMQLDDIDCKIYQPYPGSPIWNNRQSYDVEWQDVPMEDMFYKGRPGDYRGSVRTSALTTGQIVDAWIEMERTYKKWT